MHRSYSRLTETGVGYLMNIYEVAGAAALHTKAYPAVFLAEPVKAEHAYEEATCDVEAALPKSGRVKAAYLLVGGHGTSVPRRRETRVVSLHQREVHAMRISEAQYSLSEASLRLCSLYAVAGQTLNPVVQTVGRNGERHLDGEACALAPRRHLCPREEGQIGARVAFCIGVEKVVGPRVVLVDTPFNQMHTKYTRVKIEVFLRVAGYGRDMVYAPYGT